MKFVVLEQKYLEHLEAGRVLDALHVLRNELTPLQYDTPRVHRLSALMMCADPEELHARAHWPGSGAHSRANVLARVQVCNEVYSAGIGVPRAFRLKSICSVYIENVEMYSTCFDFAQI